MIEVAALTSGRSTPSRRLRILPFLSPLREQGVAVTELLAPIDKYARSSSRVLHYGLSAAKLVARLPQILRARSADAVWLERELVAGRFTLERFLPPSTVFDVDDALWLRGVPGHSERIARRCAAVVAGNEHIAAYYRPLARQVFVVPTSVDTSRWSPRPRARGEDFRVGWMGTGGNLPFLSEIAAPLAAFLQAHPRAHLFVSADEAPALRSVPPDRVRFERWSEETEVASVASFDVAVMPLPDTEWSRGKCGAKMLLAMAMEVPVIVSPVGVAAEILARGDVGWAARTAEDWRAALEAAWREREDAPRRGAIARGIVQASYSVAASAPLLARVFREAAGVGR